jgi:prepilin-type N-terminal cleavage/methylation domain-containing protein
MSFIPQRPGAGGFTLIELVVVLVILSLLTHLAVRELGKASHARMRRAAEEQIEEVQGAVWRRVSGGEPEGFLVDMGRLPRAVSETNETGRAVLSLAELWRRPDGVAPFALRAAAATNLVVPASVKEDLADESVKVPCGWRGPYLRMPFGKDRLLDPWGNPVETLDDAGFARLLAESGRAVAPGSEVRRIRHLGADARPDDVVAPEGEAERDCEAELAPGRLANPLAVTANFVNSQGPASVSGDVRCRWYMPCGGAITGGVESASLAGGAFAVFSFDSLPPGVCTLVVDVGGACRALERVTVPPGGRGLNIKVYVP